MRKTVGFRLDTELIKRLKKEREDYTQYRSLSHLVEKLLHIGLANHDAVLYIEDQNKAIQETVS